MQGGSNESSDQAPDHNLSGPPDPATRSYRTSGRPTLYLVGVPLGEEGISPPARQALADADLLICESRKQAARLYKSQELPFPREAYREWNEHSSATDMDELLDLIWRVDQAVLISDGGMPVLADPGARLVRAMRERDVHITSLPGATALTTALALCGIGGHGFEFLGFPPREKQERRRWFENLNPARRPLVFYETPYRLHKTLGELQALKAGGPTRLFLAVDLCLPGEYTLDMRLSEIGQATAGKAKGNPVFILYQDRP